MTTDTTPLCANCQRLQAEVAALRADLETLRATVTQFQRQLAAARKDSSNSSKPPSSDIVKPPKPQPPPDKHSSKAYTICICRNYRANSYNYCTR